MVYVHCFACLWWYIVKFDKSWIPYVAIDHNDDNPDFYGIYYADDTT